MPSSLMIYALGALFLFGAGAVSGFKVESWRWSASLLEQERAIAAARIAQENRYDEIAGRYERTRETLRQAQGAVRERVVEVAAGYGPAACLDDSGVQLVNRAAAGGPGPASAPRPVSGPAAAP